MHRVNVWFFCGLKERLTRGTCFGEKWKERKSSRGGKRMFLVYVPFPCEKIKRK